MKIVFNKRSLIRWKIYIDRSRMYIGYIQFFLIAIVFLEKYQDTTWGKTIFDYALFSIPVAVILFIILSLILGYLDSKLGFRQEEQRNMSYSNPFMVEMLNELKELNKKIDRIEQRNP
jgi:hypothetical protein